MPLNLLEIKRGKDTHFPNMTEHIFNYWINNRDDKKHLQEAEMQLCVNLRNIKTTDTNLIRSWMQEVNLLHNLINWT